MGFFEHFPHLEDQSYGVEGFSGCEDRAHFSYPIGQDNQLPSQTPWKDNTNCTTSTCEPSVLANTTTPNASSSKDLSSLSVERLLSDDKGSSSCDVDQHRATTGNVEKREEKMNASKPPRKYRRCSSHENLSLLCSKKSEETPKGLPRVPSAEVLTDRGIMFYSTLRTNQSSNHPPYSYYRNHMLYSSSVMGQPESERLVSSSGKRPPPSYSLFDKKGKEEYYSSEAFQSLALKSPSGEPEDIKSTKIEDRKSDSTSYRGKIVELVPIHNSHSSTVAFHNASVAANELQSELKATEELLNGAARRRRYQETLYVPLRCNELNPVHHEIPHERHNIQGELFLPCNNCSLSTVPGATLSSCCCFHQQNPSLHYSIAHSMVHPSSATSQIINPSRCANHPTDHVLSNTSHVEQQVMELHSRLSILSRENTYLKMENEQLKQQIESQPSNHKSVSS